MTRLTTITCILLLITLLAASAQQSATTEAQRSLAKQSPAFIENRGQWDNHARYLLRAPGLDLWLTNSGVVYDLNRIKHTDRGKGESAGSVANQSQSGRRIGHVVRMMFTGTLPQARVQGADQQLPHYNYFIGNDSSRWASDVLLYAGARIENLYNGIDAVFYMDSGMPRYDLVVAPGADLRSVTMKFEGTNRLYVDTDGTLAIGTSMGTLKQQGLFAYQILDGRKQQVRCAFAIHKNGSVGFSVGAYDRNKALVIDPLVYSTLVGANNMDLCNAMAIDGSGNAYLTGYTQSASYPTTTGAYDVSLSGDDEVFVTKLNSSGSALVYSTFIGGSNRDDGWGIAIDGSGNAYLTGETVSTDFPTTTGAYDVSHNGGSSDIFVTKLNSSGSALVYSTFVGGSNADVGRAITVDASGNAYVTGETSSSSFPATTGAYDASFNGITDAFILKLNSSGSARLYATFIGGGGFDRATAIAIDGNGNAFITGLTYTSSVQFPTTSGAYDELHNGGEDVFVTKLNSSGSSLGYSTFLGGSNDEEGLGITVDGSGDAYVTGHTASANFPTQSALDASHNGNDDAFITELNTAGSALVYSTFVGGRSYDYGNAIALDGNGNVYITGNTSSSNFPTTSDAYDVTYHDSDDVFLMKVNSSGSTTLYSTMMGGRVFDQGNSVGLDANGNVYVAGYTYSNNFPTTTEAYARSSSGSYDAFVAKFSLGAAQSITLTAPNGGEAWCAGSAQAISWTSIGIGALNVRIELSSDAGATFPVTIVSATPASADSYAWAIPTSLAPGNRYMIRVIVNGGTVLDTSNATFTINAPPKIVLQPGDLVKCPGDTAEFAVAATGTGLKYQWRRNGTPITGATAPLYSKIGLIASDTGTYDVIVSGTCAPPDTSRKVRLNFNPQLAIVSQPQDQSVCEGEKITLSVRATGKLLNFVWRKNGKIIPTAVDSIFVISSAAFSDSGSYDVIVGGICGSPDTSVVAVVHVNQTTAIVTQPEKLIDTAAGAIITLHVSAHGSSLSYQWRKEGKNIPGATDSLYTIDSVGIDNIGFYDVIVKGKCGPAVRSDTVLLRVHGVSDVPPLSAVGSTGTSLTVIPNPASGTTRLIVHLPSVVHVDRGVELELYDLLGNSVLDLSESFSRGRYQFAEFDAGVLPSGLYYCYLSMSEWKGRIGTIVVAR